MTDDKQWHLDRRVPLALILAIIGQSAAAIWFASSINSRVDELERLAEQGRVDSRTIVKLETLVDELRRIVGRLEAAPRR